jgi:hypothetical protein
MKHTLAFGLLSLLVACGPSTDEQGTGVAADASAQAGTTSPAPFGKTPEEIATAERNKALAGLGPRWVSAAVTTEHDSPNGPVTNRIYRGQKLTIYEVRSGWARTTADGFTPRWSRLKDLATTEPASPTEYAGPEQYQDARIAPDAIPNPGDYNLTKADVDILWKGAKLVLDTRDCGRVTMADKSVSKKNTYYVTCEAGGAHNIFFTKAEALAAK